MVKWEYKNIYLKSTGFRNLTDLDQLDNLMNSLGAEGWELVSTIRIGKRESHGTP